MRRRHRPDGAYWNIAKEWQTWLHLPAQTGKAGKGAGRLRRLSEKPCPTAHPLHGPTIRHWWNYPYGQRPALTGPAAQQNPWCLAIFCRSCGQKTTWLPARPGSHRGMPCRLARSQRFPEDGLSNRLAGKKWRSPSAHRWWPPMHHKIKCHRFPILSSRLQDFVSHGVSPATTRLKSRSGT
jgi:hypothetical protein